MTDARLEREAAGSTRVVAFLTFLIGAAGVAVGLVGSMAASNLRLGFFGMFISGALACGLGFWCARQRLPALLVLAALAGMETLTMLIGVLVLFRQGSTLKALNVGVSLLGLALLYGTALTRAARREGRLDDIGRIVLVLGSLVLSIVAIGLVVGIVLPDSLRLVLHGGAIVTVLGTLLGLRLLPGSDRGFRLPTNWIHSAWPLAAAAVLGWAAHRYVGLLVAWMGPSILQLQRQFEAVSMPERWIVFLVVAPVFEEILFRGVFQERMKSLWGAPTAILAGSALFAISHASPATLPVLILAGLTAGLARELSGSLIPCILFHAAYNAWLLI